MKVRVIKHPFCNGETLSTLCCLRCDEPMLKVKKGIKIGRQLGEDGWYCEDCKFFFFERDGVMYFCIVRNEYQSDIYKRCQEEHFAIFLKKPLSCF